MGANIVANFIGEEGSNCFIKAAVCVQPPLKMWVSGENIQRNLFGFYNYVLGQAIKAKLMEYVPNLQESYMRNHGIDLSKSLKNCKNLTHIDT